MKKLLIIIVSVISISSICDAQMVPQVLNLKINGIGGSGVVIDNIFFKDTTITPDGDTYDFAIPTPSLKSINSPVYLINEPGDKLPVEKNSNSIILHFNLPPTQQFRVIVSGKLTSSSSSGGSGDFNFDSALATKTTSDLAEGTNLYWTNARGDARYPQLSGSYSNPSWLTGLAWSKITGTPSFIQASDTAGMLSPYLRSNVAAATYQPIGSYAPTSFKTTLDGLNGIIKSNGSGTYSAITDNSSNWNTAYSWGNHASAGYATITGVQTLTNKTLTSPKLNTSSTTGYVWTATDNSGSGSWQAAPSGGTINWGDIGGDMSNQSDLIDSLNKKVDKDSTFELAAGTNVTFTTSGDTTYINAAGGSSETMEQTLQNQGSTAFTTDNTVDFGGHTLSLTNLGGQWSIHGTNGFGYNNAIGSPSTPNDIGIYQSTGAYNSSIVLHENKAKITADEINISNIAGTDGYTLPTTDGSNGQVLTTDGSGAVSWQTGSGAGSSTYSSLSDVNLISIADGQLVKWNNTSSKWENFDITSDKPTLLTYNSSTGHFDLDTTLQHTYNFYNTKYMPLPSSPSNGDILYYNSGWQKLAKGNDGNILELASGLPTWLAPNYGDSASHAIYAKTDNNLVVKLSLSDTVTSTSTAWQGSPFLEHSATGWSSSLASSMTAKVQQGIVITGAPASSWTNFKYSWYMSRRSSGMPVQEAMFLDETLGFATLNVPNIYATSLTRTASLQTGNISNATGGIVISPVAQSNVVGNYSAISIAASSNNTSTHYFNGLVINSTQNRSGGSGTSTDFLIHRVETALSSGTQRFISADISGTEKFAVDNKGRIMTTIPVDYTTLSPGTPSYSLGTGAGTSATASISGSDADGLITINTGTTPTAGGDIITITFTAALTNSSKIQLTAYNSPASKCDVYINSDSSGFTIKNTDATDGGSALPASKTLIFHYTTTQ